MLIHPSHRPDIPFALGIMLIVGLTLLGLYAMPQLLWTTPSARSLPTHLGLETLTIGLAITITALTWGTRREHVPNNMLLLGMGFLGIATLDFSHMQSTPGMSFYASDNAVDKSLYFWFAARLLGVAMLLQMAAQSWRKEIPRRQALLWAASLALYIVGAQVGILYASESWPAFFRPGEGLTRAKIYSEYLLIGLHIATITVLCKRLRQAREFNASALLAAVCCMAVTEFLFTLTPQHSDLHNLTGHLFKVLAYLFLTYTIFSETVLRPYAQLRLSQEKIRATLSALPDLLFVMDEHGRYLEVLTGCHDDLSHPLPDIVDKTVHELMPPASAQATLQALAHAQQHGIARGTLIQLPTQDGYLSTFELSIARQPLEPGRARSFLVVSRNVTERERIQQSLRQLSQAVEQNPVSIVITDMQARIEYVNAAFTRTTGYSASEVLGKNSRMLQSGKTPHSSYQAMWNNLTQGLPWQGEVINRSKDGRDIVEAMLMYPLRDQQGHITHYLAHKEDITEEKRSAARIQQLSHYDQLTGLPNRRLLQEQFALACQHPSHQLALLWIDLDHFKNINDALGHGMGDQLLVHTAQRLRQGLRAADTLARISGDDFIALLPGANQHIATEIAQTLLQQLEHPVVLGEQEVLISASIGIAMYPADSKNFDTLLQSAEAAKYRVKDKGRNHYGFYTPELQEHAARYLALSNALKQALQRQELYLMYQPQMSLHDGRITGMEALLRWHNPQWGHISPGEFIPIAETNGTITALGTWVLETALQQMRCWLDAGLAPLKVAVNLSALQFNQEDLPQQVAQALHTSGVPPELLELELTEAVAMQDPELGAQRMAQLSALGVKLAIDDFGTGYSSLSCLKRFALHKLKIDQSFVRELSSNSDDQAITTTIVHMARNLGLSTIAEGVETHEQLEFLRAQGCDTIQGYLLSRPLLPDDLEAFVRSNSAIALSKK